MEDSRQPDPVVPAAEQLEVLSQVVTEALLEPSLEELRQYCVFRAGRERFCFSVLDVDEVWNGRGSRAFRWAPIS